MNIEDELMKEGLKCPDNIGTEINDIALIILLIKILEPSFILELGTYTGKMASILQKYTKIPVITVDNGETGNRYKEHMDKYIVAIQYDATDYLKDCKLDLSNAFVFVDDGHSYDTTIKQLKILQEKHTKTIVVHDIFNSEVQRAFLDAQSDDYYSTMVTQSKQGIGIMIRK